MDFIELDTEAMADDTSSLSSLSSIMDMDFPTGPIALTTFIADLSEEAPTVAIVSEGTITWPVSETPLEIFEAITFYLSRKELGALRLVSREFDRKVSARYFKNVVVPFRSELYGELSPDKSGVRRHPSSALFSSGMRIFQDFGPHILRFALSLEIDEDALAYPPIKPHQEAIPSFWGIYRWPHTSYNRYADLEGIEHTADETEAMKEALKCLTKVTNLGICCDAGLGFLIRPDISARKAQHPVFGIQYGRREQRPELNEFASAAVLTDFNGASSRRRNSGADPVQLKLNILKKMMTDAGYSESQAGEATRLLLHTERIDLNSIDFDERNINVNRPTDGTFEDHRPEYDLDRPDTTRFPLAPAYLTRGQKELLLELDWAHNAMIQSYVLGILDNAIEGRLNNLTVLTIAKIPSSHLHNFYRDQFWSSFPALTTVSLGVVADWRRISKPAPGCIEDVSVSPVAAVGKVYKLLHNYIGKQPQIEKLSFEWICGGEFAPSSYQRNQYVLPAPFHERPCDMSSPGGATTFSTQLLSLPHIKHLSLKNCWSSPHVLFEIVRRMALSSLDRLELESVSLSGQPTLVPQASLVNAQNQPPPPWYQRYNQYISDSRQHT